MICMSHRAWTELEGTAGASSEGEVEPETIGMDLISPEWRQRSLKEAAETESGKAWPKSHCIPAYTARA